MHALFDGDYEFIFKNMDKISYEDIFIDNWLLEASSRKHTLLLDTIYHKFKEDVDQEKPRIHYIHYRINRLYFAIYCHRDIVELEQIVAVSNVNEQAGFDRLTGDSLAQFGPLNLAIYLRQTDTINLLLESGAKVNVRHFEAWPPLFYAVLLNDYALCQLLIEKGADVNFYRMNGDTALSLSFIKGYEKIYKLLLESNAQHKPQYSPNVHTPVMQQLRLGNYDMASKLVRAGFDYHHGTYRDGNALFFAVKNGLVEQVELLLEHDGDIDYVLRQKKDDFLYAMKYDSAQARERALDFSADKTDLQISLRDIAMIMGHDSTLELLNNYKQQKCITILK